MTISHRLRGVLFVSILASASGCASVPLATKDRDDAAKSFATRKDMANIYIYRSSSFGTAVKFPVVLDGKMLGELPGATFVLATVPPGQHTVYVSAENSESKSLSAEPGKNHYVKVSPAMGWLSARVGLSVIEDEKEARSDIVECRLIQGIQ